MLWFNLIFVLKFLKRFISFKPVCLFVFQTSSIIQLGCRGGAVLRALASHHCGLEVPLNS